MSILDETLAQQIDDNSGLNVTNRMKGNWMTTSKWAMFLAILGFVFLGIRLLSIGGAASSLQAMRMIGGDNPIFGMVEMLLPYLTIIILVTVAVLFFVYFFLLRFSTQIQRAVNFTDQAAFVNAWQNMRNHYRILGILICVSLVFYAIMIVVMFTVIASKNSFPME